MKRIFLILTVSVLFTHLGVAQNESDALRYAQTFPGGTARFSAMAGSFGALGGDFSSLSINPAGIAIYRGSEFSITPSVNYSQVTSRYFNNREEDMKYNFNLNSLGLVFAIPLNNEGTQSGWQYFNIGLGFNRQNNFNNRWIAEGFNPENSFMTSMLAQANREGLGGLDPFSTGLAWDTYLLDYHDGYGFYVDMPNGQVLQRRETTLSGSLNELVFSLGANYGDRLYLGASMGIPNLSYKEESVFGEEDRNDINPVFNSLTYTHNIRTRGSGFNFKLGAIIRVTDVIRLGGAFHTPTFFELDDRYHSSMRADLNLDVDTRFKRSPIGRFDYEINTPMKAVGSLGLVFGGRGLINIDYEYIDYTKTRLRHSEYLFTSENNRIKEAFTEQHNLRIGGELLLNPLIIRAGYAYYSSPYKPGVNDGQRSLIAAGIGIREGNYFIDFAYTYAFYSEDFFLYDLNNLKPVSRDFASSAFRVTVGWRF